MTTSALADEAALETSTSDAVPTDEAQPTELTLETLVTAVHRSFSAPNRERITLQTVRNVIATLDLSEFIPSVTPPRLHLVRLRFIGDKKLHNAEQPAPICYDQTFAPGVNVVLIPDNDVGKSSIWKTIKFALTGDNSDYDVDVKGWIRQIWLTFRLDDRHYTIVMCLLPEGPRAVLVPGATFDAVDDIAKSTSTFFDVTGSEVVKAELQHFFFQQLGLREFFWTQEDASSGSGVALRRTSWLTYFQALVIPDGGDRYLICDQAHAMGNQDGLILSAFLGLRLTEPLNRLGIERRGAEAKMRQEKQSSEQDQQQAEAEIVRLTESANAARVALTRLERTQQERRRAIEESEPAQRLAETQSLILARVAERAALEEERQQITSRIVKDWSRVQHLRESIALALHFTGLEVSLCPNCDAEIDQAAAVREREDHVCRLCNKPAHSATADELSAKEGEAKATEEAIREAEHSRGLIARRLAEIREELEALERTAQHLHEAAQRGVSYVLPTPEEKEEQARLLTELGRVQAQIDLAHNRARKREPQIEALDVQQRIIAKVREVVQRQAERLNENKLQELSRLTQEIAERIGADSVTELACSALGRVALRKHGIPVRFTGIQNQGERLRIKLAFFLAMMRLGREPGLGRHPGLLLIDQPTSAEMVPADVHALARIFHQIDADYGHQLQVLCFTARPEFSAATAPGKTYGPQADRFAF